jgi:hypothetical protein
VLRFLYVLTAAGIKQVGKKKGFNHEKNFADSRRSSGSGSVSLQP